MDFYEGLSRILGLGLEPSDLSFVQVSLRAIIVFLSTLVIVRLAEKRFLAQLNALDAILGFMLASTLSRAINGSGPFFPTIAAGFLIVLLHRVLATIACRWHTFGALVKGTEEIVVQDGKVIDRVLKKNHISKGDLIEELRLNGNTESLEKVKKATIERRGEISVIHREEG